MGCNSSKSTVVEPGKWGTARGSVKGPPTKVNAEGQNTSEDTKYPASEAFIIPLDDPMEAIPVGPNVTSGGGEVAAGGDGGVSYQSFKPLPTPNVAKKPPKRIQELMDQASNPEQTIKLEDVEEKLLRAEQRRKELMQQKIDSIQRSTQMLQNFRPNRDAIAEQADDQKEAEDGGDRRMEYANAIKSKALDDDSKRELLTTGMNT